MKLLYKSRLQDFARKNGISDKQLPDIFEWYATYLFLSRYGTRDIRVTEKSLIPGDDGGIDAVAVMVNGNYVSDASEVQELLRPGDDNSVRIGFLQAKTSSNFDTKLISRFLNGVKRMTVAAGEGEYSKLEHSLREKSTILTEVINNISRISTSRIPCDIFYVTLSENSFGTWDDSQEKLTYGTQVDDEVSSLRGLDVYDFKNLKFVGQDAIDGRIEELKGHLEASFKMPSAVEIPAAKSVERALIGIISVDQLKSVILDDNRELRENLFEDNVRLYQGEAAAVNRDIAATLRSDDRVKFPFLNNGLTIVTRGLKASFDNYNMRGYQIVNGCQTTTEIARWLVTLEDQSPHKADAMAKSVTVPIKIIHTGDRQSLRDITVATNSQTPITASDIRANSELAMRIEEYFASIADGDSSGRIKLRYKRQSGESDDSNIPALRTYDTTELSRAFVACVYGESSQAISQSKRLISDDSTVWDEKLNLTEALFYFAALVIYRVERALVRPDAAGIKPAKYHIAMMASRIAAPKLEELVASLPVDKKRQKEIEKIIDKGEWASRLNDAVSQAIDIVRNYFSDILEEKSLVKDDVRSKKVQQALYSALP